jgi:hypothetical protein
VLIVTVECAPAVERTLDCGFGSNNHKPDLDYNSTDVEHSPAIHHPDDDRACRRCRRRNRC